MFSDPGPVKTIEIKDNLATSVLVTWEPPEIALSCVEEYTIKTITKACLTNPSNCIWTYLNSSSIKNEAKITSLQPCTDYVLYVYANGRLSDEDTSITFRTAFQGMDIFLFTDFGKKAKFSRDYKKLDFLKAFTNEKL